MRRSIIALFATLIAGAAAAQETVTVGLILPLTGPQGSIGKQVEAGARLYLRQNGTEVAGKRLNVVVRDDGAVADTTKRLAQDLIVNHKAAIVAGFGITPTALAVAPLATQAKVVQLVMAAGTSSITERSPYVVRTSFTLAQSSVIIADWAARNGVRTVVTMVSDYAPGADAHAFFKDRFVKAGGQVVGEIKFPLANPDFAPFLQRAADARPDAIFVFVPAGQGGAFMKQYAERGLDKMGIRVIGPGDVTDDDLLNGMGEAAIGAVTAHMYSAHHPSEKNRAFVAAFEQAFGYRPNFMAVGGYDGMHLIFEALRRTGGAADADTVIAAMKGLSWESPRGPIAIDPQTRDIVQNIYVRKVERIGGQLHNVEFATFEAVKDPGKP